jgi:hypothetical protein
MNVRFRPTSAGLLAGLLALGAPLAAQDADPKKGPPTAEEKAAREKEKKAAEAQKQTWLTAYKPTRIPDRVVLTWNGPPATSQAVTWRTDVTVTKAVGQVALSEGGPGFDPLGAKARPVADKVTTVEARTESLRSDLFEANYHSVGFTGLKPKTGTCTGSATGPCGASGSSSRRPATSPSRCGSSTSATPRTTSSRTGRGWSAGRTRTCPRRTSSSTPAT